MIAGFLKNGIFLNFVHYLLGCLKNCATITPARTQEDPSGGPFKRLLIYESDAGRAANPLDGPRHDPA
jgi:hypothetical protein